MGIGFVLVALFAGVWYGLIQLAKVIIGRARGWYRLPAWIVAAVLIWGPLMLL